LLDLRKSSIWIAAAVAPSLVTACSVQTRYRVLSFFFDGVPEPVQPGAGPNSAAPTAEKPEPYVRPRRVIYYHPPYRENRCRACHSPEGGLLYKTAKEGLCQTCHPDVPGEVPYLHGPLAVGECLSCHDPHQSEHPGLLFDDVRNVCLSCHDAAQVEDGAHHKSIGTRSCIECHYPHGGNDRFFLKRSGP
jgi:predicted CXXCH cytochrome family protein